ncbi:MAG: sugar ABC transporter ATP-binding protein [Geminicoccales bacterium]
MLLRAQHISKSYPGVKALGDVDFEIDAGEILAVVGENGAGKSTLMKILSGAVQAESGDIYLDGEKVRFSKPQDAQDRGICTIYQELMLIPELTVVENVYLGHLKSKALGMLDWKAMRLEATEVLGKLGFTASLDAKVGDLSVAEQQLIEIGKSLSRRSRLLIMDEPTASLSKEEIGNLFQVVRQIRGRGIAVVFITHHLHEIFEICDRLLVLRDGRYVGKALTNEITEKQLAAMMLGRAEQANGSTKHREALRREEIVLSAKDISGAGLNNVNITLHRGEVLGIAGLMGAGRTELVRFLFGADRRDSGEICVNGELSAISAPRAALNAGIGLAPEDRKTEGLILSMPIGHNVTLPAIRKFAGFFGLRLAEERQTAASLCDRLLVKYASLAHPVATLSGGNQQKIVLSKLVGAGTQIYLLDEPTRGIDIGAKEAIFDLIWTLTSEGASVIVISSAIEELIRVCDTIVCLHLGTVTHVYERTDFDLNAIMLNVMGKRSGDIHGEAAG